MRHPEGESAFLRGLDDPLGALEFMPIGISTSVCFPCSSAASDISTWVSLGPAIMTTSTLRPADDAAVPARA
jgi:hypothetical protein